MGCKTILDRKTRGLEVFLHDSSECLRLQADFSLVVGVVRHQIHKSSAAVIGRALGPQGRLITCLLQGCKPMDDIHDFHLFLLKICTPV